jgi:uncharacterized phage protein (TIGR01671 family)
MRDYRFRGKRIDNRKWIYGYYLKRWMGREYKHFIFDELYEYEVDLKTIGQYTGLKDKNGKEIYEGDIYKKHNNTYLVIWTSHGFMWQTIYDNWLNKNIFSRAEKSWLSEIDCKNFIEVIGNIHDNPELIHDQKAEVEQ